jgi:hypothetical protein
MAVINMKNILSLTSFVYGYEGFVGSVM